MTIVDELPNKDDVYYVGYGQAIEDVKKEVDKLK